ncbi:Isochorismatase-like protein [Mycena albidolilacea]|uniref:Isochorismatase-like protein n=1 Tax=Mycena albidolilacea TaxID=1033008 RepID=A0AAD7EMB8_9AGAR|nr:Isochorismatase-like protein [Mycena albidolilacea]
MSVKFPSRPALIVVDVQNGLFLSHQLLQVHNAHYTYDRIQTPALRSVGKFPTVEPRHWEHSFYHTGFQAASLPVIHISHDSLEESSPLCKLCPEGYATMPEAAPVGNEVVFVKHINSGFIGTGLEAHLRATKIDTLVILGLTTSHCVSTTTRMAGNFGFTVCLPRDATVMFERPAAPGNSRSKRLDDA